MNFLLFGQRIQRKLNFNPGALGIRVDDWNSGYIVDVKNGSQAEQVGVKNCWWVKDIDGDGVSRSTLISKVRGDKPFYIIFDCEVTSSKQIL